MEIETSGRVSALFNQLEFYSKVVNVLDAAAHGDVGLSIVDTSKTISRGFALPDEVIGEIRRVYQKLVEATKADILAL